MFHQFHVYLYGPNRGPLPTSFEQASERLESLPKLHFEPDGSFVWSLQGGAEQVYGMLYDAGGVVQYCDIRGICQRATWRLLCQAITGTEVFDGLGVLCLPESLWQDFQTFEQLAWS